MSLRHALLGLLADHPASGYDLLRLFKESLANVWPATQSQIYTELTKLAATDRISVSDEGPRGRKEYTITPQGRADLHTWLTDPTPPTPARNETLLRVFFLDALTPTEAATYLTTVEARSTAALEALETVKSATDWTDAPLAVNGRLAIEWGERFHRMNQEWAQWAKQQVT
ncbi:PadR family transcriptional regulator [Nocardia sp. AG03]|uniref:PadR family transcriptional regulator n=1 Tax=Nocardia sp. AG03 TaxID=3025312 RepID=UPI002418843E|nr:PadR family transcriptional regulator [Nocardia sp. AG03]